MEQHEHHKSTFHPNWGLLAGGATLAIYGLSRRTKTGTILATAAGLLALEGARVCAARTSGECEV